MCISYKGYLLFHARFLKPNIKALNYLHFLLDLASPVVISLHTNTTKLMEQFPKTQTLAICEACE